MAATAAIVAAVALGGGVEDSSANRVLLPPFAGEQAAWSPDSRLIAIPDAKAISLLGIDGNVQRRLRGPSIDYFDFPCEECPLGWTADGTRIQFLSHEEELESDDAIVGSVAVDGSDEQYRSLGVPVGAAAWGPTGWPLIYVPNARTITGMKGKLIGPRPDLWRLDSLYATPRKILASRAEENDPRFSPDGTEITFMREGERSTSLWIAQADGTSPHRLIGHLLGPSAAAWSPDGRRIALSTFSRKKNDRRCHLYLLSANGGQPHRIVDEEILSNRPAWTPDGRWIAFSTYDGEIRKIHPDGTGLRTIVRLPGKEIRGLSWSPDGASLGYTARVFPKSD
jgi:dipeptidyl aminopeptidase/acylaminoacyl peptidase